MKTILFPTDFSENSENAIRFGISLFGKVPCKFIFLNAFYIPNSSLEVSFTMYDTVEENVKESFEALVTRLNDEYPGNTFEIETLFQISEVSTSVSHVASEKNVDYIVMGTKGTSGIIENLAGSNTLSVVKNVEVPVLVIPEDCEYRELNQIVLAADVEHELTAEILDPLMFFVRKYNASLNVLHVADPKEDRGEVARELESLPYLSDVKHDIHMIEGEEVVNEIEGYIEKNDVYLIAMVKWKRSLFDRIFHKSVTNKLTLHSQIPMLILHSDSE